ncbi:hypothetical protein PILCRDRAFT_693982 [Piloderma croceum F 1598]|uniref:Uncharacterized protein n=1 Tax=Piloderma croceum (strain F 1598) TaxID=765440 RepID=A0A0C3EQF8_PILCF|nr:hypothetical protein PILCRDRAFT_693982 [Piloderma croceum F 1598]
MHSCISRIVICTSDSSSALSTTSIVDVFWSEVRRIGATTIICYQLAICSSLITTFFTLP